MMTTEQIAGLAALLTDATPGPWQSHGSHFYGPDPDSVLIGNMWGGGPFDANLALIARAPDLAADVLRLTATVADLNAANIALVTECARLKGRDEVLRSIADLTEISRAKFRGENPELNKLLDDAGCENWGEALSEFAARAYLAGGAE